MILISSTVTDRGFEKAFVTRYGDGSPQWIPGANPGRKPGDKVCYPAGDRPADYTMMTHSERSKTRFC